MAFTAAAGLLTITPGADTAMVLRTAVASGPRRAGFAALGIGLGCLVWGAGVSFGLGVLLTASALAFTILKLAGAAYLVWMGVGLIFKPRRSVVLASGAGSSNQTSAAALRRGFLTNMLNPKIGVFYVTFLPQFVASGANVAAYSFVLACIHILLGALWAMVLIGATAPLGQALRRPKVVKTMDRLTGCVFVAFGAKLALSDRL